MDTKRKVKRSPRKKLRAVRRSLLLVVHLAQKNLRPVKEVQAPQRHLKKRAQALATIQKAHTTQKRRMRKKRRRVSQNLEAEADSKALLFCPKLTNSR